VRVKKKKKKILINGARAHARPAPAGSTVQSCAPRGRSVACLVVRLATFRTAAVAGAILVATACPAARADGLSSGEAARLTHGETIVRPQTVENSSRRYVGGVTYTVVDGTAEDLGRLLDDVGVWQRILPKTRSVRRIGASRGDALVELKSGNALVQATYTMRVRREGTAAVRFWIDPSQPHDIEDAWGFVRADPMADGRALVTYGVLVDIGPGIIRDLFEDRVRQLALSVPDRLRGLLSERTLARATPFAAP
jgi:hypothetical protein